MHLDGDSIHARQIERIGCGAADDQDLGVIAGERLAGPIPRHDQIALTAADDDRGTGAVVRVAHQAPAGKGTRVQPQHVLPIVRHGFGQRFNRIGDRRARAEDVAERNPRTHRKRVGKPEVGQNLSNVQSRRTGRHIEVAAQIHSRVKHRQQRQGVRKIVCGGEALIQPQLAIVVDIVELQERITRQAQPRRHADDRFP